MRASKIFCSGVLVIFFLSLALEPAALYAAAAKPAKTASDSGKTQSGKNEGITKTPPVLPPPPIPNASGTNNRPPQLNISPTTAQDKLSRETKKGSTVNISSASGAARYYFPLEAPAGRNGMQPPLNLAYNSDNRNQMNFFGAGWSLDTGSITRISKIGSEKLYTANDFILNIFDGSSRLKPLVLSDGTHGTYGAEIESGFAKIEFRPDDSWVMTDKSGTVFTFGAGPEGRQEETSRIYRWMIQEARDQNDNFMRFTYTKDSGVIIPDKIFYTGHAASDGIFEVSFVTEPRPDVTTSNLAQFTATNNFRVREVNVKVSGTIRKRYTFAYGSGGNGTRSVLSSITPAGIDAQGGLSAFPPTQFEYNHKPKNWSENAAWRLPVEFDGYSGGINFDTGARFADLNADALPDIILRTTNENTVYMNTGSGWQRDLSWMLPVYTVYNGLDTGVRFADINNDGRADIIAQGQNTIVYINTGSGWSAAPSWHFPNSGAWNGPQQGAQIEDVNGDGLVDVIKQSACCPWQGPQIFINTGADWVLDQSWNFPLAFFLDPSSGIDLGVRMADVNGDGLVDVMQGRSQYPQGADINAVYLNTGTGWRHEAALRLPELFVDINRQDLGVRFADVNGDSLVDIMKSFYTGGGYPVRTVYINTGSGWRADPGWQVPTDFEGVNYITKAVQILDVNGDGLTDVLVGKNDGTYNWNHAYINSAGSQAQLDDALVRMTGKEGGTSAITYVPSTTYLNGQGSMANRAPLVIQTVGSIETNDLAGTTARKNFSYHNGFYYLDPGDIHKNTFAGFEKVTTTEATGDYSVENFYVGKTSNPSDHYSLISRMYRKDFTESGGALLKSIRYNWSYARLGSDRYFPKLDRAAEISYDGGNVDRTSAVGYAYDSSGNVSQQVSYGEVNNTTFADIGTDSKRIDYTYATDPGGEIRSAVATEITYDHGGNRIGEVHHLYDNNALATVTVGDETRAEYWKSDTNTYIGKDATYNSYGMMLTQSDLRGNATTITYDTYNVYPASVSNALSQTTAFDYDPATSQVALMRDPNSLAKTATYDGFGRPLTVSINGNLAEEYTYGDSAFPNSVRKIVHPGSGSDLEEMAYFDGFGRLIQSRKLQEVAGSYSVTRTVYDGKGRVSRTYLPVTENGSAYTAGSATPAEIFAYDGLDRVTRITSPIGQESIEFHGWNKTIIDANGHLKISHQDAYSRLAALDEFSAGNTHTTAYTYDPLGNLIRITDANGNLRNFTYDSLGRRLTSQDVHAVSDSSFSNWTYSYDAHGNLLTVTDAAGRLITYTYDALNRVSSEDLSETTGIDTTYVYDAGVRGVGRLSSAVRGVVSSSYEYNTQGQVSSEVKTISGTAYTTAYVYDRLGRVTQQTEPNGAISFYTFNQQGLVESIDLQQPGLTRAPLLLNKDYSASGQPLLATYANGISSAFTYDNALRLRTKVTTNTATAAVIQNLSYTYDAASNITRLVESAETLGKKDAIYVYDELDRLTSAAITNVAAQTTPYTSTFMYDTLGNFVTKSDVGAYSYAGAGYANPHAVTSITSTSGAAQAFTYDANGNMTADGSRLLAWNTKNELRSVTMGAVTTNFTYDHRGSRVGKTSPSSSVSYVSGSYEVEANASAGQILRNYISDGSELLATLEVSTATLPGSTPTNTLFFTHTDHLGTSSLVTLGSAANAGKGYVPGAITEEFDAYPFGESRANVTRASLGTPRKYTGKELDEETGLYYYGARYYAPRIGRFVSADPASMHLKDPRSFINPQGWNSYSYAVNNPMRFTDPTGESWEEFKNYWKFGVYVTNQNIANYERLAIDMEQTGGSYIISPEANKYLSNRNHDIFIANQLNSCLFCSNESTGNSSNINISQLSDEGLIQNRETINANSAEAITNAIPIVGPINKVTKVLKTEQRAIKTLRNIKGFTEHGIDQIISRGIKPEYIKDTITKTIKYVERIDDFGRTSYRYIGKKAVLNFNKAKEFVTGWLK